jgi:hypothetical protein
VGVTVAGTLNFDNCDGLTGSGTVAGMKWCDDGGDHPLYAIVAESKVGPGRNGIQNNKRMAIDSRSEGWHMCRRTF